MRLSQGHKWAPSEEGFSALSAEQVPPVLRKRNQTKNAKQCNNKWEKGPVGQLNKHKKKGGSRPLRRCCGGGDSLRKRSRAGARLRSHVDRPTERTKGEDNLQ